MHQINTGFVYCEKHKMVNNLLFKKALLQLGIIFFLLIGYWHSASGEGQIMSKQQMCLHAQKGVTGISPSRLKSKIDSREKFILLDVRTEAEYRAGYISGAVWMPRGMLELKIQELLPMPDTEIIIYCGQDCRGYLAVKTLTAMGYTRVSNLIGGIKNWASAGYPLYNTLGEIKQLRFGVEDPRKNAESR
jgi:rhodanese-related sulfurtransferase